MDICVCVYYLLASHREVGTEDSPPPAEQIPMNTLSSTSTQFLIFGRLGKQDVQEWDYQWDSRHSRNLCRPHPNWNSPTKAGNITGRADVD